jgi:hypothetical protein
MTRRIQLHRRFYAYPTRENLDELIHCLKRCADNHIMTHREADFIIEKAEEHYEMCKLQQNTDDL